MAKSRAKRRLKGVRNAKPDIICSHVHYIAKIARMRQATVESFPQHSPNHPYDRRFMGGTGLSKSTMNVITIVQNATPGFLRSEVIAQFYSDVTTRGMRIRATQDNKCGSQRQTSGRGNSAQRRPAAPKSIFQILVPRSRQ